MTLSHLIRWMLVLAALLAVVPESTAQGNISGRRFLQIGVAVLPGVGLQFGYVGRYSFYTVESTLFADG